MSSKEQSSKPDLYVVARIIKILRENSRMKRTTLATASGLAYDKMIKYLEWMMEKGFVETDSEGFCLPYEERRGGLREPREVDPRAYWKAGVSKVLSGYSISRGLADLEDFLSCFLNNM